MKDFKNQTDRLRPFLLLSSFIGLAFVIIHPPNVSYQVYMLFKYLAIISISLLCISLLYHIYVSIKTLQSPKHDATLQEYSKMDCFMNTIFLFILIGCCIYIF